MDTLSKEKRSWLMSRVRSKDTKPELYVRSVLHRMGYRFKVGGKGLPGHPDIVLKKYNACIFVHGCFWHQHDNCRKSRLPKTNTTFWENKITRNVTRDKKNEELLKALGWNVIVLWECELNSEDKLIGVIYHMLTLEGTGMTDFKEWLISNKNMKDASARDVVSRLNRAINILKSSYDSISCESLTDDNLGKVSIFVKSQLRRAVRLWTEFNSEQKR